MSRFWDSFAGKTVLFNGAVSGTLCSNGSVSGTISIGRRKTFTWRVRPHRRPVSSSSPATSSEAVDFITVLRSQPVHSQSAATDGKHSPALSA